MTIYICSLHLNVLGIHGLFMKRAQAICRRDAMLGMQST
jgi:hypothetical protein